MQTAEISMDVDKRYYNAEIPHVKALMRRKLMLEVERSLKFKFGKTWSPVPGACRIVASVTWEAEK
jgi:hypothetical protein